jgi:D-alanyl-lipoteichoic acid acyltransferase DltB (MBOAT superfamily)
VRDIAGALGQIMQGTDAVKPVGIGASRAPMSSADIRLGDFLIVALQLVLVLLLLRQFQIEGKAFVELAALAFVGFALHAFMPLHLRMPFFALLSLASIGIVLGAANGAWIIAIGAVLIAICHLPMSVRARTLLLLAAGGVLMAQRAALLPIPWSEAIWPILGSMFMFRLIVYFYDLRHDKAPVTAAQSVSYFAMLPNVCFPLFPVIDFKTYRRSHYSHDAYVTYQRGVDWIVRGVVHLLLYRYFYYHVTLAPSEVAAPAQLLQYLVANFMLYLRVSGLFHLVVGMLHLYGFHLPETHNRYLLASSFTDFWRRINIYWKDFMQKIFYFPAVFALKRLGTTRAVIVATMYVFVLTWFLHSYQWFWLRGSWLFAWQDILFWAVLGVLVVLNSLYEIKFGRSRSLGAPAWSARGVAINVLKAYATFWFICVLWSFWTSESIGSWWSMWQAVKGPYTPQVLIFPLLALVVIALGSIPHQSLTTARKPQEVQRLVRRDRTVTVFMLVALLALSMEDLNRQLGAGIATTMNSLRSAHLSRLDNAKLERGYYEGLMAVDKFNSQLWEVYSKKPANWLAADFTGLKRFTDNFAQTELVPSSVSMSQYGPITTNRFGLRDKDYADQRPAGTLRVAVLGPSSVMGWGVADGEPFEAVLEERLNSAPLGTGYKAFEFLNFGVPGYQPPQELVNFERSLELQPNMVFYVATGRELRRSASYLAEVVRKRIAIPYPGLQAIVHKSGVTPEMEETEALRRLEPLGGEILRVVYQTISERCRELSIQPVWVFLPQVRTGSWQEETPMALQLAQQAGFEIINLDDVYSGHDIEAIRLAEWDDHPNALGHRLVAERLYAELAKRADALLSAPPR